MKHKIFLAYALVACSTVIAQESFSYKGVALGDSMELFLEKLPYYECATSGCSFSLDKCYGSSMGILDDAIYKAYEKRGRECREKTSFGGALVSYGQARFIDNKLVELSLIIPTPHVEKLDAVLLAKFGPPISNDTTPVKNRAGGTFNNWSKKWESSSGTMSVLLRSGKIDEGLVMLRSSEAEKKDAEQRKSSIEAGKKDF